MKNKPSNYRYKSVFCRLSLRELSKTALFVLAFALASGILHAQGLLTWAGGPVVQNARIVAIYWGTPDPDFQSRMNRFYSTIAASSYLSWLSDYSTGPIAQGRPGQTIGTGTFAGSYTIETSGGGNVETTDIGPEIDHLIHIGTIKGHDVNTVYMVHFSSRWNPYLGSNLFGFPIGASGQAYHASYVSQFTGRTIVFASLPDQDIFPTCSVGTNRFDAETTCASHELIEAITDPGAAIIIGGFLSVGIGEKWAWQVPGSSKAFDPWEIADQCEAQWIGIIKTSADPLDTYTVSKGWQDRSSSCVVSAPIGHADGTARDASGYLHAYGWALDPNSEFAQTQVHLYFDGPFLFGTGYIAFADQDRPDVNSVTGYQGWHGFNFTIPPNYLDGREHTIWVYGIGVNNGNNSFIGTISFQGGLALPQ